MQVFLRIIAQNRPGVLDRITGLLRRNSWNIDSLSAGDCGGGVSQINLSIHGKDVEWEILDSYLAELDGIVEWSLCDPTTHAIRELLLFRLPLDAAPPQEEGIQLLEEKAGWTIYQWAASPAQIEALLPALRELGALTVRTGALLLPHAEGEEIHG